MLKALIKKHIKPLTPVSVWTKFSAVWQYWQYKKTFREVKQCIERSDDGPEWLANDQLKELQKAYRAHDSYRYDPDTLEKRGSQRAQSMLNLIPKEAGSVRRFLELGCKDAMACCALQKKGKSVTGIDLVSNLLDDRAAAAGVDFRQMDAMNMSFENGSFDFIFSYNAFEHFSDPETVLNESLRVLKKGGYLYLSFGPLYMSALGLHVYKSIHVPYSQFLFPKQLIDEYIKNNNLKPGPYVNKWSIDDYRILWERNSALLKKVIYKESRSCEYSDLIMKYPSCFKSKIKRIDDLFIHHIEVLFKKISN